MNSYEGIFVIDPELNEEDQGKIQNSIKEGITKQSGVVESAENWGRKKLAYKVSKRRDGVYYFVKFKADPGVISKMNKNYKLNESILKTLIINMESK